MADKEYEIGVRWELYKRVKITASSLDEAIKKAREINLPSGGEYIDGSFEVDIGMLEENYPEEDFGHFYNSGGLDR